MLGFGKKKKSVLIVDDNQSVADGLAKYFDHNGLAAETSYSAAALRERLARPAPSVLILDVCLGDGDGIELLQESRKSWPDTPAVILTGLGYDDELMRRAREEGAQGFISKTVPPAELLAKVIGVLEHPEHRK